MTLTNTIFRVRKKFLFGIKFQQNMSAVYRRYAIIVSMELYTYHSIDFDITTQIPDPQKSIWRNDECPEIAHKFSAAYDFLYEKVGSHNVIWCYGAPVTFSNGKNKYQSFESQRLWHLDVPDKQITAIDSSIWDFVINGWYYISDEAFTHFVKDDKDSDRFDELIAEFYQNNPFNSYNKIIKPLTKADPFRDQFLIIAPIKKHWVIRTYIITPEKKPIIQNKERTP